MTNTHMRGYYKRPCRYIQTRGVSKSPPCVPQVALPVVKYHTEDT